MHKTEGWTWFITLERFIGIEKGTNTTLDAFKLLEIYRNIELLGKMKINSTIKLEKLSSHVTSLCEIFQWNRHIGV